MNTEIETIRSWAVSNNLLLNIAKTKAMVVGSSKYLSAMQSESMSDIRVGNEAVLLSKSFLFGHDHYEYTGLE